MRRPRMSKVGFNTQLIIDVIGAKIIVEQLPRLLAGIIPLDPMLQTVAGVGGGYVAGSMLKRPNLANASIAIGALEFITPMIDNLLGTGIPPQGGTVAALPPIKPGKRPNIEPVYKMPVVDDFLRLNDYVSGWSDQSNQVYSNSY